VPEANINEETLDLWILLLADSGCSKTYASNNIIKLFPEGTFSHQIKNVVSEKSLCIEMKKIQNGLWVQDEGLKFLLSIENKNSPLQAVKPLLLELKTTGNYTRIHSKPEESIVLNDNAYSLLFLGTCREFDLSKKTLKSTYDGLFRRFQFVDGSDKLGRKMEDYPLYRFPIEQIKHLEQRIKAVLNQEFFPRYKFKEEAIDLYETTFKAIIQRELKEGVTVLGIFDSCFSGSILDLKYMYNDSLNFDKYTEYDKEFETKGSVICLSSSNDNQTSSEALVNSKQRGAFCACLTDLITDKNITHCQLTKLLPPYSRFGK
jgi:hypothetical protein